MSKLDGRVRDSRGRLEAGRHSYEWLLQYPQVKDWIGMYPNLHTRVSYLRGLEAVVKVTGKKPPELLALPSEEARRTILSALRGWIQEGKVRAAARTQIIMRTFYEANDRELPFKRGDRVKDVVKKIGVQYIPGKEDVYRMVDALGGELRNKAIILCLFQSGARVGGALSVDVQPR